jgi:hypothetical protein
MNCYCVSDETEWPEQDESSFIPKEGCPTICADEPELFLLALHGLQQLRHTQIVGGDHFKVNLNKNLLKLMIAETGYNIFGTQKISDFLFSLRQMINWGRYSLSK